jgi:hypothetical protein
MRIPVAFLSLMHLHLLTAAAQNKDAQGFFLLCAATSGADLV